MKCVYRPRPNIEFEVSGENVKDIFTGLAVASEVFGEEKCGNCGHTELRFVVRKVNSGKKDFVYYEMVCRKCGHRLAFGQLSDGSNGLYPKRFDENKQPIGKYGWFKYEKEAAKEE